MTLGGPLDSIRKGAGCQRNQIKAGSEGWDFQPHPLEFQEGRGAGDLVTSGQ